VKRGAYELNSIITGDARELSKAIPDNSVDLIFTDPVYDQIEDYEWLAETAARVLKDDRACLVWCGKNTDFQCARVMIGKLDYVLTLNIFMSGVTVGRHYRNMFVKTSPCLYLEKGRCNPNKRIWDISIGVSNSRKNGNYHKWGKDPITTTRWIEAFTKPNDIILDPFTGGGTVPAVCKMLNRQYLAFEIDPATADIARQRVANTQPPLPIVYPEQMELSYDHP
jgi:DNA modification methylase